MYSWYLWPFCLCLPVCCVWYVYCSSHRRTGSMTRQTEAEGKGGVIKENWIWKGPWWGEFLFGINMHCKVRAVMIREEGRLYWEVNGFCCSLRMTNSVLGGPWTMPDCSQCIGYGNDGIRVISDRCEWEMMICGFVIQSPRHLRFSMITAESLI